MSATLKSKAIHGICWSSLERIAQQGTQFVITIMLARLLVPEQFGLIGMLFVFIELAWVFLDSGFGAALIQKKEVTVIDECSMFYFNILVGFLGTGLLCVAAPWIAAFYRQPILTPLTRVLSLAILINSFASVQTTLLSKRLDFKTQLKVGVAATGLSGTIAIALAIKGFGVWSLVGQYVGNSFFRSLFLWYLSPWRPKPVFSFRSLREMFTFGSRLLASSLLNTMFDNIYPVLIGRLFSATQLGLYASASRIQRLPTLNITGVVMRVAFPVFSMIQDDPVHLKRSMRKAATVLAFVFFPLMTGLALLAGPLVRLLLREEWMALVPWLQLLCLAGVLYPFHALHLNLLTARGRSDLFFRLEVLKKILILVAVAITYRWGVTAMIWGQIVLSVLCYYINSYYTNRLIQYSLREQLADLAPYAMTSVFMGMSLYGIQAVPVPENGLSLVLAVLTGGTLYLALSRLLGLSALIETTQVVARSFSRT